MEDWAIVENGVALSKILTRRDEPVGTQVVLKVTYCGVCHSDLYFQDGQYDLGQGKKLSLADRGVKLPLVPGHETVGRVVAVGPDAKGVKIGEQFIAFPWAGCGHCNRCRADLEHLCLAPRTLGVLKSGGYGGYVTVERPEHLVSFGDIDPALAATYACSGITAYSAVRKLPDTFREDPVVVFGAGGLGLAAVNILKALSFEQIIVVDIDPSKLAAAREAGATHTVDGRTGNTAANIMKVAKSPIIGALDFVASSDTAQVALEVLGKGGTYVPVGLYGGDITLSLPMLPLRAISIRGSYTGSLVELRELVELAKAGKLTPIPIERVPHDDPNNALDRVRSGKVKGRLVLEVASNAGTSNSLNSQLSD